MYSIFLDDERLVERIYPKNTKQVIKDKNMIVCRSYDEAVALVLKKGFLPNYVSFDNDLGEDENGVPLLEGKDFANWLIECDLDGKMEFPNDFEFWVHSANPVQVQEIKIKLDNYLKFKKENSND